MTIIIVYYYVFRFEFEAKATNKPHSPVNTFVPVYPNFIPDEEYFEKVLTLKSNSIMESYAIVLANFTWGKIIFCCVFSIISSLKLFTLTTSRRVVICKKINLSL